VLATGATVARDLSIAGRDSDGVHMAMEFLHKNTKALLDGGNVGSDWRRWWGSEDSETAPIDAFGKKVIVIGGGDTGNDCIGTAVRQGCQSLVNFEVMPQPPEVRASSNPWPHWPVVYKVDYGHEEVATRDGKDPREFLISTKEFLQDEAGHVTGVKTVRVQWVNENGQMKLQEVAGSEEIFEADLVLLALGFIGPEATIGNALNVDFDQRGNFKADWGTWNTSNGKVFACGDCRRGQSLVVWAIKEGRECAASVHGFLMDQPTEAQGGRHGLTAAAL